MPSEKRVMDGRAPRTARDRNFSHMISHQWPPGGAIPSATDPIGTLRADGVRDARLDDSPSPVVVPHGADDRMEPDARGRSPLPKSPAPSRLSEKLR